MLNATLITNASRCWYSTGTRNSYSQFGLRGRAPRGVTGELSPARLPMAWHLHASGIRRAFATAGKAVFKGRRRRIQAACGRFRARLEGCVLS